MDTTQQSLRKRITILLIVFIVGLVISGVTAYPLLQELEILNGFAGENSELARVFPALGLWISRVHSGLANTYAEYPFIAYGTDWLAFAHIVIAIAFIGPLRDPVKNVWVIEFGMIACALIIPQAIISGQVRGIPFCWRLIDCSFGIVGFAPLYLARKYALLLAGR